jgi:hypothetical protein
MEQHTPTPAKNSAPPTKAVSTWIVVWITAGLSLVALTIGIIALVSPGRPGKDGNAGQDGKDGKDGEPGRNGTEVDLGETGTEVVIDDKIVWGKSGYLARVEWSKVFFHNNARKREYNIPEGFEPTRNLVTRSDTMMLNGETPIRLEIEVIPRTPGNPGVLRFKTSVNMGTATANSTGGLSYIR